MPDGKTISLITAFVCIILVFIFQEILTKRRRIAERDMEAVRQVVRTLVPDGTGLITAYARFVSTEDDNGRCAVAFKPGVLYVIPLRFTGGAMGHETPMLFTPDDLSQVKREAGRVRLYDLAGDFLFSLEVLADNRRDVPREPCSIRQKKEAKAFQRFLKEFEEQTNITPV